VSDRQANGVAAELVVRCGGEVWAAEVFARGGRLHVDGAAVGCPHAFLIDGGAEPSEPNRLRVVDAELRTVVEMEVPSTSDGEEWLRALEVDRFREPVSFVAGRPRMDGLELTMSLLAVGAIAGLMALVHPLLALMPPHVALVAGLAYRRSRTTVICDAGQLTIREPVIADRRGSVGHSTRKLAWSDIVGSEPMFDDGVRLSLTSITPRGDRPAFANPERMKGGYEDVRARDPIDLRGLDAERSTALHHLVLRGKGAVARLAADRDDGGAAGLRVDAGLAARLALGGRDPAAWRASLERLVTADYREAIPDDDDLTSLARDLDQDTSARLAAALILRRRGRTAPRVCVDPARDTDPALRQRLEAMTG
jgi:hypothetical protein